MCERLPVRACVRACVRVCVPLPSPSLPLPAPPYPSLPLPASPCPIPTPHCPSLPLPAPSLPLPAPPCLSLPPPYPSLPPPCPLRLVARWPAVSSSNGSLRTSRPSTWMVSLLPRGQYRAFPMIFPLSSVGVEVAIRLGYSVVAAHAARASLCPSQWPCCQHHKGPHFQLVNVCVRGLTSLLLVVWRKCFSTTWTISKHEGGGVCCLRYVLSSLCCTTTAVTLCACGLAGL